MSNQSFHAIVLGLGGMGSAAIFQLASRGCKVLGLEQYQSPHDLGSSHGATRVVRQAYFEHPSYVPLLLRSYELWREIERVSGRELLMLPGGLMMGSPDSEVVCGSIRSAQEYGLPHEVLVARQIRSRFPQFRIPDNTVALFEKTGGLVWCEAAISAHLEVAKTKGAELRFNERVHGWEVNEVTGGVTVRTSLGIYTADRLIITLGPWAPEVMNQLNLPLRVTRQVLFWIKPSCGIEPFLPERFPIYIYQNPPYNEVYGFPAVDGSDGGVKIAFFHQPRPTYVTPESVDRFTNCDDERNLREAIQEVLPSLDGPLLRSKVCLYTMTPDSHFIICSHPLHKQVSFACGFSGHGYKFCPVVGEILADLALENRTRHDLSLFDPKRFESIGN